MRWRDNIWSDLETPTEEMETNCTFSQDKKMNKNMFFLFQNFRNNKRKSQDIFQRCLYYSVKVKATEI